MEGRCCWKCSKKRAEQQTWSLEIYIFLVRPVNVSFLLYKWSVWYICSSDFMILLEITGNTSMNNSNTMNIFHIVIRQKRQKKVNLKTGVTRKQSRSNFSKTEHFLPPDTYTHVWDSPFCLITDDLFTDRIVATISPQFYRHVLFRFEH